MGSSKQIQYTLTLSVTLKIYIYMFIFGGMFTLQLRKIAKIFRIFGNTCLPFIGCRGVLNQMDLDGYSAIFNI